MTLHLSTHQVLLTTTAFAVAICATVYLTLSVLRYRGVLNESYRRHKRRKTDRNKLSRFDRKIIRKAKNLRADGRTAEAAKVLEDNGLLREAVYIADKDGLVLQAAEILLRAGKPHRAGAVYAKHKKWKEAIDCFVQANMPYEVATCYRKLGDHKNACEYYKTAKRFGDAAWCYEQLGQFQAAARLFRISEQPDRAAEQYLRLATENLELNPIMLDQAEIDFLLFKIELSSDRERFIDLLRRANALPDLLRTLPRLTNHLQIVDAMVKVGSPAEWATVMNATSAVSPEIRALMARKLADVTGIVHPTSIKGTEPIAGSSQVLVDSQRGLSDSPLFASLPIQVRNEIWHSGRVSRVPAGQLLQTSSGPRSLYLILNGEAEWRETSGGRGKVVLRRGVGTVVGFRQILFEETAEEQVLAFRDCEIWGIGVSTIDSILEKNPTVAKLFYKALAREHLNSELTYDNQRKLIA